MHNPTARQENRAPVGPALKYSATPCLSGECTRYRVEG